jgi:putative acetyltransferase
MVAKGYDVRPFLPGDGDALASIFRRSVAELARADYTEAQRRAWLSRAPSGDAIELAYGDGRRAFVGVDGTGCPVGFSDVEHDGHIQFLYVHPAAAGRGVAARLLAALEAAARVDGLTLLFSEASETALPVFTMSGFRIVRRRDFDIDGVAIHNYAVEKNLVA